MASTLLCWMMCAVTGGASDCTIVHFTATWCQPCKQLEPSLRQLRQDGWDVRSVDADQYPQYVTAYQVKNLPTLVILQEGQEVDRIVGLVPFEQIQQRLRRAAARNQPAPIAPTTPATSHASPQSMVRGQSPSGISAATRSVVHAAAATRQTPHSASAITLEQAIARAARATVRIRVEEANTLAHGTGTVIDTHENEALVLTCGHLFRDMQPGSQISVDLFAGTPQEINIPAQLIDFVADDADIGLISFRTPVHIEPVPLLPYGEQVQVQQPAFSFGCDHGHAPTRRDTTIAQLNRFLGPANVEIEGAPSVGRSGGGLFDYQGRLIGVCNAADTESDQGIYAAADVIYAQLQRLQLDHLFTPTSNTPDATLVASDVSTPGDNSGTPAALATQLQALPTASPTRPTSLPADLSAADHSSLPTSPPVNGLSNAATQVICIVRNANGEDRVVRIDAPDHQFLQQLETLSR